MIQTVGVADMKVSSSVEDVILTHALGSCLGVTVYDPVARAGGMLHVMLPLSTMGSDSSGNNPYMFVDTGVPRLFLECYKLGVQKGRAVIMVAGGAHTRDSEADDFFQIGKRNFIMLRKLLWKNGVLIESYDVGGKDSRTMSLNVGTGEVTLRVNGSTRTL